MSKVAKKLLQVPKGTKMLPSNLRLGLAVAAMDSSAGVLFSCLNSIILL